MKTSTAALGLASISLVGLVAGRSFFSSTEEARRAGSGPHATALAGVTPDASVAPTPVSAAARPAPAVAATRATDPAPAAPARARTVPGGRVDPHPARRPSPRVAPTAQQLAKLRASLASLDPGERLVAARYVRQLDATALLPDLRALLQTETCLPVRRVATQLLAQADPTLSLDLLTRLRQDPDAVVRINAAYGLARAGDEEQQAWLLGVYDAAKVGAPRLVPVVAAALEDPAMRSPAVVARFQAIVQDPAKDPAQRERAARVLRTKLGA